MNIAKRIFMKIERKFHKNFTFQSIFQIPRDPIFEFSPPTDKKFFSFDNQHELRRKFFQCAFFSLAKSVSNLLQIWMKRAEFNLLRKSIVTSSMGWAKERKDEKDFPLAIVMNIYVI